MRTPLSIPPQIDAVIDRFDASAEVFDAFAVRNALTTAASELPNSTDEERSGARAEILAFSLVADQSNYRPWGTYLGPSGSAVAKDGTTRYFPDIAGTDPRTVAYWAARARHCKHPLLRARYADLAWDMARPIADERPDVEMARIASDAYLESAGTAIQPDIYDRHLAVLRALDLAVTIRDAERRDRARKVLLELHSEVVRAGRGPWWLAANRLLQKRHAGTTDEERAELVANLETLVAQHADVSRPEAFDPHSTKHAAELLIQHYRKVGKRDDVVRLQTNIGRTFEQFAGLGNAMLGSAVLQTAVNAYRDAGLAQESNRARVVMEQKIQQSHEEMVATTIEREIPVDDMDRFLDDIVVPELARTFAGIAVAFLLQRSELERQVTELQEAAPLSSIITQTIMAERHVAAHVGSVTDDPGGRLIQLAAQHLALADIWLVNTFDRAIERHELTPEHFVGWVARSLLYDNLSLLLEGVMAWFQRDFVKAIHVLVPQVESGLRTIAEKLGKPVTKRHPRIADTSVAVGMGDILFSDEIAGALGRNLALHFAALYADPRGINLRNDLAHGLLRADQIGAGLASRVVHSLLMLGIWDKLAKTESTA